LFSLTFSSCKACNGKKEDNSAKKDGRTKEDYVVDMRNLVVPPSPPKPTPEEEAAFERAWKETEVEKARLYQVEMAEKAQAKAIVQEVQRMLDGAGGAGGTDKGDGVAKESWTQTQKSTKVLEDAARRVR
jgi:hypothetical protein